MRDGLHPSPRGQRLIGDLICRKLGEIDLLSPAETRRIDEVIVYDSAAPNRLRGRVELLTRPLHATAGTSLTLAVRATNTGDTTWLAESLNGFGRVRIGFVAYDDTGRKIERFRWSHLPHDVAPGETVRAEWAVGAFGAAGSYVAEVGLVLEQVAWFKELGDRPTTAPLTVDPPPNR
jgi:hypothetical protein